MTHPSVHARTNPDKVIYRIADSAEAITYGQLDAASNQVAQLLRARGLRPGDHIAFLLSNRLEFLVLCWAAQRTGIYYTPVSTHLHEEEIAYIVANSSARVFVTEPEFAEMAGRLRKDMPAHVAAFSLGGAIAGYENWEESVSAQPATPVPDEVAGYTMVYSSGTTGRPKGVKPPFRDEPITSATPLLLVLCRDVCGIMPNSVYLSPAPLYHAAPLHFLMMVGVLGASAVIERKFAPEDFLRHVDAYSATHAQLVPTMFVRMLKLPEEIRARYSLATLRAAIHAAAPCPEHVKRAMIDWWGPKLVEYYGASEAYGITFIDSTDWLAHPGSVGRARVGEIRIVDEDGNEVPRRQTGTIYVSDGPRFSYHDEPEKTAAAFNAQGWATVGDVGRLDEDGYLYLTDRRDYVINSGGAKIYPQRCEDLLISHPHVMDAAVFGVPDEDMGEVVKAVVQLAPGETASVTLAAELIAYCRAGLPGISVPRSVDFTDTLPRTPTGKLNKRVLRDKYRMGTQN